MRLSPASKLCRAKGSTVLSGYPKFRGHSTVVANAKRKICVLCFSVDALTEVLMGVGRQTCMACLQSGPGMLVQEDPGTRWRFRNLNYKFETERLQTQDRVGMEQAKHAQVHIEQSSVSGYHPIPQRTASNRLKELIRTLLRSATCCVLLTSTILL